MEAGCTMTHLKKSGAKDEDATGKLRSGYAFNLHSKTMICGVNEELVEECRAVVMSN